MSKIYLGALAMFLLLFVACDVDDGDSVDIGDEVNPILKEQLQNPPSLSVVSGDQKVLTVLGTYSWTIDLGNNESEHIEADSDNPMGLVEHQTMSMTVKPGDRIQIKPLFEDVRLVVTQWTSSGPGETISLTNNSFLLPSGQASQVYEVHVFYDQGNAYYAFEVTINEGATSLYPAIDDLNALHTAYKRDPYNYAKETDAYKSVVSLGVTTITYCQSVLSQLGEDLTAIDNKNFYEWVISETIRSTFPEDLYAGRVMNLETTTKSDCQTYAIIGNEEMLWSELKKDTLIQITEMLNMDYFIGRRISEAFSEGNTEIDGVSFMIKREDMTRSFEQATMGFHIPRLSYLNDYQFIAISDDGPVIDQGGPSYVEIPVYDQPNESGTFIGYVYAGDLLKYARDDDGKPVKSGGWSLVDIIPYAWCINSNSAWISDEHLQAVTEETVANAGFVLAGTQYYLKPDLGSPALLSSATSDPNFVDPFKYGDVYCLRVLGEEGDFYQISDEVNGNVHGYVLKDDLFFYVGDSLVNHLQTFKPNMQAFITRVKNRINSWEVDLSSKDWDINYTLTAGQKESLAQSLKSIEAWQLFDGGIKEHREAAYPYISLDLGDCELIVAEGGSLLVMTTVEDSYKYGLGTRGAPIRFITPNTEFIEALFKLVEVPENKDPDRLLYLLNAKTVEVIPADQETGYFHDQQVHINHAVRGLIQVVGQPIEEVADGDYKNKYTFRFTMPDGQVSDVMYEDRRMHYNGQWYKASEDVLETVGNMFAGYF